MTSINVVKIPAFTSRQEIRIRVGLPPNSNVRSLQASFQYVTNSGQGELILARGGVKDDEENYVELIEEPPPSYGKEIPRKAPGDYRFNTLYIHEEGKAGYYIGHPLPEGVSLKILEQEPSPMGQDEEESQSHFDFRR